MPPSASRLVPRTVTVPAESPVVTIVLPASKNVSHTVDVQGPSVSVVQPFGGGVLPAYETVPKWPEASLWCRPGAPADA